jgi:AAA+ superfamily predicted ATPase
MSSLTGVITALKAAAEANPQDLSLRLHLAAVLTQDGQAQVALEQYSAVLTQDPANLEALKGAADAAERFNDSVRAAAYRKLHSALSGVPAPVQQAAVAAAPVVPTPVAPTPGAPAAVASGPVSPPPTSFGGGSPSSHPRLRVIQGGVRNEDEAVEQQDTPDPDGGVPSITLADVGGLEQVKRRLDMAFLAPLRNPEIRRMYGKKLRGGLLMYGPPGCGKTYIARALAGEVKAGFMSVGLSDVLDMYLGESERKLHELFETARRSAPIVLFFDEIDALGQKRAHQKQSAGRNVVNQLLTEMDSVNADNEGIFILGATNHPWDVDAALRRAGRFDRVVLVLPPDAPAREAILTRHMAGRPAGEINIADIARQTSHFSGADLAHLCESATELAMEDALRSGTARPVTMADFKKALKDVHPSTRPWFDLARNYAMFANEGGMYDDLLAYIKEHKF